MRSLDALSWPARRWLCDRLVGQHAYSRNTYLWTFNGCTFDPDPGPGVVVADMVTSGNNRIRFTNCTASPFDQERSA